MTERKRHSITSYDVAQVAGVSQSAVSRAFSPGSPLSEEKRRHILTVAADMGYQPNAIARSMSTARKALPQRSGMVGVIVTRMEDPFFAQTLALFSRMFQERGLHVLLFTVDSEPEVDAALASLMQYKIDGVVILSALLSSHMAEVCEGRGTPVLLYNRRAPGPGVSAVQIDNRAAAGTVAAHLVETGHSRIAFLGGGADDATSRERDEGFSAALAAHGLAPWLRDHGDYTFASGAAAAHRLLSRDGRPDAVFCASDVMALGLLHAARHDLGLDAPRDFSLVGFDDIPEAGWPGHRLTTMRQPVAQMIAAAVGILCARIDTPDTAAQVALYPGELIERGTVRRQQGA
ncbi:MAG: LacI family DNA-binding transcriptional regulator [Rubellimicrobium sp.]|nr:LacI family DNA-binding transcriptional regulator [Rubellimicrobium sp.]